MSTDLENSVGLVTPQRMRVDAPFSLVAGDGDASPRRLPGFELVYESYGRLNEDRSNAILICHALSGDHHAAGYHDESDQKLGWWENMIGPGRPIDTNRFYVVCLNNLGGCGGSTGPLSENPETGGIYGPDFPMMTVRDWVRSQALLADYLQIGKWAAVVGGSLGGMQAMQWAMDFPERIGNAFVIAAAAKLSTQNIAFNEVARQAIRGDPAYHDGHYHKHGEVPVRGLMLARMLGHITYLSDDVLDRRFGRDLRHGRLRYAMDTEFEVESYLHHQGKSFVDRFDANSYMLMTKALDYFDPAKDSGGDLAAAFAPAQARFVVLSFSSDWRFSSARSKEIVQALIRARKKVQYIDIQSERGHDSFLIGIPEYHKAIRTAMDNIIPAGGAA